MADSFISPRGHLDGEYPLEIEWNELLADDELRTNNFVDKLTHALGALAGGSDYGTIDNLELRLSSILHVSNLNEYFRKPSGFFADHLKKYSKSRRQAPIYWPLSTASGSYTLWLYYHRLTADTLYTAVNRFVDPKLADVGRQITALEGQLAGASGRDAARLRDQVETTRAFRDELREFRAELRRVADLPYRPDLNDGVIINAAPLHKLFRLPKWAKDTRECWEKLERGEYDWAHLAFTIWPDRVREKCRHDRSLAIAHGLEELYEAPPAETRRQGRAARVVQTEDEDE